MYIVWTRVFRPDAVQTALGLFRQIRVAGSDAVESMDSKGSRRNF